jgi:hypothetical protein
MPRITSARNKKAFNVKMVNDTTKLSLENKQEIEVVELVCGVISGL